LTRFQWIDGDDIERLLEDIRRANSGQLDPGAFADAPVLDGRKVVQGRCYALTGVVTGHPHLQDGREIVTSQLFWLDEELGICRTMNRWYRLYTQNRRGH
jgi:hypothetical protein